MSNQNQKRQIRAYMREHDVNYTTARRAVLNATQVNPQTGDLSAHGLRVGGEVFDLTSLVTNGFYDPPGTVAPVTVVDVRGDGDPGQCVLDALSDMGATNITPLPAGGGTGDPVGFEVEFPRAPQDVRAFRRQVQERLDTLAVSHDWRYVWDGRMLCATAAPPLPSLAPFPAEGSSEREAWNEQFRRGVIGLGPAKGGGIAALDLGRSPHVLVGGYTGSGKTILANLMLAGVVANPGHVEAVVVDGHGLEYEWVADAENVSLVTGPDLHTGARDALEETIKEMQHRQQLLAKHGAGSLTELRDQGVPEIPPRRLVVLDNAGALFTPDKDPNLAAVQAEARAFAEQIAMLGRCMDVNLVALTQRPSHHSLGIGLLAQFTNRIVIGLMGHPSVLRILGHDSALPENAPKGRGRFVTTDGGDVEMQVYAATVAELGNHETDTTGAQGAHAPATPGPQAAAGRLIVDFTADPGAAAHAAAFAAARGRRFRHFTLADKSGAPYHPPHPEAPAQPAFYDPLRRGNATSKTDMLVNSVGRDGDAAAYFRATHELIEVAFAVADLCGYDKDKGGFQVLVDLLDVDNLHNAVAQQPQRVLDGRASMTEYLNVRAQAQEMVAMMRRDEILRGAAFDLARLLSTYGNGPAAGPWLRPGPDSEADIDLYRAVYDGDIVVFSLSVQDYGELAKNIGTLVLLDLQNVISQPHGDPAPGPRQPRFDVHVIGAATLDASTAQALDTVDRQGRVQVQLTVG